MSTSGEIFAQHPSVLNRYFKGSAAREAEKATVELPPVGGPPLSIFVLLFLFEARKSAKQKMKLFWHF